MSTNNSIFCPYCHEYTSLTIQALYTVRIKGVLLQYQIGECNGCGKCVLLLRPTNSSSVASSERIMIVYPNPLPNEVSNIIPEVIKNDISEARLCLSVSAFRGAATLARRALQVICLEKGSKKDRLADQIDELFDKNIITDDIKKWAHEIRYIGNDAAHPNDAPVLKEDAEEILELLDSMCEVLYIAPAKAEKRREARELKKEQK
jgi:hypothetical protein